MKRKTIILDNVVLNTRTILNPEAKDPEDSVCLELILPKSEVSKLERKFKAEISQGQVFLDYKTSVKNKSTFVVTRFEWINNYKFFQNGGVVQHKNLPFSRVRVKANIYLSGGALRPRSFVIQQVLPDSLDLDNITINKSNLVDLDEERKKRIVVLDKIEERETESFQEDYSREMNGLEGI